MKIFSKSQVTEVANAIMNDGFAIILPCDTVWAITAKDETKIYSVKKRPLVKKVSLFIDSLDQVALPSFYKQVLSKYVPGELSFIWKGQNYRVPNNKFLQELLAITGPIYQSSANISGQEPITSLEEGQQVFADAEKIGIVEKTSDDIMSGHSSTIIDLDTLKLIRVGPVDGNKVLQELQKGMN